MARIVLDIETIGVEFNLLDLKSQEYLLRSAQNKEEKEEIKRKTALSPFTGEVVAIGLLNPDTDKGAIFFQTANEKVEPLTEKGISFEPGNEKEILEKFWEKIKAYNQVITFNGRGFDLPFLMIRSAFHKIRPSRNLLGYRYEFQNHCDLLDQLTFYGQSRRYNLDFYTRSFGFRSPKENGDGSKVGNLYQEKKFLEIARYCLRDLVATKELFEIWDKYLRFS